MPHISHFFHQQLKLKCSKKFTLWNSNRNHHTNNCSKWRKYFHWFTPKNNLMFKKWQNSVHLVVECPLSKLLFILFLAASLYSWKKRYPRLDEILRKISIKCRRNSILSRKQWHSLSFECRNHPPHPLSTTLWCLIVFFNEQCSANFS